MRVKKPEERRTVGGIPVGATSDGHGIPRSTSEQEEEQTGDDSVVQRSSCLFVVAGGDASAARRWAMGPGWLYNWPGRALGSAGVETWSGREGMTADGSRGAGVVLYARGTHARGSDQDVRQRLQGVQARRRQGTQGVRGTRRGCAAASRRLSQP